MSASSKKFGLIVMLDRCSCLQTLSDGIARLGSTTKVDNWSHGRCGNSISSKIIECLNKIHIFINNSSLPDGPLGPLQVVENYSGRGLGKIVCKETLRQIASMANDNVAMIFEWNAPSRAIFEKLGFQLQAGKIYRIFSMPTEYIENSN